MTTCNYCHKPADVRFQYQGYLACCIVRRQPRVIVAACAEHEGCRNWASVRARHPDIPLERRKGTTWEAATGQ